MTDLLHKLSDLARRLRDPALAATVTQAVTAIENLRTEREIDMRTFAQAAQILVDHDKAQTAEVATLTTQVADLTAKLAAAQQTPEVAAAEQAVVDQAAVAVPEIAPSA